MEEVGAAMDKIVVRYVPRPQDYSDAIKIFLSNRHVMASIFRGFIGVLIFIMIGGLLLNIGRSDFQNVAYYLPVLILIMLFFFLPAMSGFSTAKRVSKQPQLLQNSTYEFDEEIIQIINELSESKMHWGVFDKALESDGYYYLIYVTNKNMFQFIPKRIFESTAQESDFRQLVEQKLGKIENIQKGLRGWKLSLLVFIVLLAGIVFCGFATFLLSILSDYAL
jgi:hypothetical protein